MITLLATSSIFNSAQQKISRAKQHAVEFNSMEQDYLKNECSGVMTEVDAASGDRIVKVRFFKTVPLEIASVVSDVANNLRDSLDHMGYAVAQAAKKGSQPKQAGFPFAGSAEQLENSIKRRSKDIPDDILNLFRGLKPHKGGDEQLYALNTIANADKHQMLQPMAIASGQVNMGFGRIRGGALGIGGFTWDPVRNEIIVSRCSKDTIVDDSSIGLQLYLCFDETTLEAGDAVGRILDVLAYKVENILGSVEVESKRIGLIT